MRHTQSFKSYSNCIKCWKLQKERINTENLTKVELPLRIWLWVSKAAFDKCPDRRKYPMERKKKWVWTENQFQLTELWASRHLSSVSVLHWCKAKISLFSSFTTITEPMDQFQLPEHPTNELWAPEAWQISLLSLLSKNWQNHPLQWKKLWFSPTSILPPTITPTGYQSTAENSPKQRYSVLEFLSLRLDSKLQNPDWEG